MTCQSRELVVSVLLDGVGTMTTRKGKVELELEAVVVVTVVVAIVVGTRSDLPHPVPAVFGRAVVVDLRRLIVVAVAEDCLVVDQSGEDLPRHGVATFRDFDTVTGECHMVRPLVLVREPR